MRVLGIFGLVSVLCTFAIMFYMMGNQAESLGPIMNNAKPKPKKEGEKRLLSLPYGANIQLQSLQAAFLSYRMSKGDLPKSSHLSSPPQSSNDILRLLFKSGTRAEKSFSFKGSFIAHDSPDGNTSGNNALSAGENHWAYVEAPQNIESYSTVPMLIEPYRPGESSYRMEDYGPGRDVLVLFSDGSVKTVAINSEGELVLRGKNILSSDYPGWRGATPKVYQPQQK